MPAAATQQNAGPLEIRALEATKLLVPIIGTAPLIMHRFSEKAKRQMLDAQQGRKNAKVARDPKADYEGAFYRFKENEERYGFPVIAFKAATVSAARFFDKSVTMTALRQTMFFTGEVGLDGQQLAQIDGEPRMREDVVRLGISGTDLRFRPEFTEWSTTLEVTFVASALTQDSVLSLIDAGGMGVGVGEWRPEKSGDMGTYRVDPTKDLKVITG